MTDTLVVEASKAGHSPTGRREYRDEQLFARLIGAAVLLAIAVIFLPFVLDGSGSQREYEYAETLPVEPPRPTVETSFSSRQPLDPALSLESIDVSVPATTPLTGLEAPALKASENEVVPDNSTAGVTPIADLQMQPLQLGWNIQVASFVKEINAIKLINRLRAENHVVYANRVTGTKRTLIRVLIGPYNNQIDALATQNQIDQQYRVESLIVRGQ